MCETKKKALVVDDEGEVRAFISAVLEDEGWEIVEGCDGHEAVALANTETPDLVLLDVMMPGKDGFEAYRELRENEDTAHIPVVMLTAVNDFDLGDPHDAESMARHLDVPAPQAFVEKPLDTTKILAAVSEAMDD